MLVPLSREELRRKILAIFKHQSQKDVAPFPGPTDEREFWQRVEARNTTTAQEVDALGLDRLAALPELTGRIVEGTRVVAVARWVALANSSGLLPATLKCQGIRQMNSESPHGGILTAVRIWSTTRTGVPVCALPPSPGAKAPIGCFLSIEFGESRKLPGGVTLASASPSRNMTPLNETLLGPILGSPRKPAPKLPGGICPPKSGAVPGSALIRTLSGLTISNCATATVEPLHGPSTTSRASSTAPAL